MNKESRRMVGTKVISESGRCGQAGRISEGSTISEGVHEKR